MEAGGEEYWMVAGSGWDNQEEDREEYKEDMKSPIPEGKFRNKPSR